MHILYSQQDQGPPVQPYRNSPFPWRHSFMLVVTWNFESKNKLPPKMPQPQPELKKVRFSFLQHSKLTDPHLVQYLDKRLFVQLNGSRKVIGLLRGYDVRSNLRFPTCFCMRTSPTNSFIVAVSKYRPG